MGHTACTKSQCLYEGVLYLYLLYLQNLLLKLGRLTHTHTHTYIHTYIGQSSVSESGVYEDEITAEELYTLSPEVF